MVLGLSRQVAATWTRHGPSKIMSNNQQDGVLAKAHLLEDRARAFVICLPDRLYLRLFEAVTAMAFGHVLDLDIRQTPPG
jgi:hypothetical protein